jgi:hypothetical protein
VAGAGSAWVWQSAGGVAGAEVEFVGADSVMQHGPLSSCWNLAFERVAPVRAFASFRGQRNRPGLWWFASTGEKVAVTVSGAWRRSGQAGPGRSDAVPGGPVAGPHRPVPGASAQARRGESTSNDDPVPSRLPARITAHLAPPSVLCIIALAVVGHSRLAEPAAMAGTFPRW